jgi:indole-3-glycerol phosphate synthase
MDQIPAGVTVVSESGIGSPEQLSKLADAGVDAVLVGETLMRSADPEAALRTLRGDRAGGGDGSSERRAERGFQ